MKYTVTVLVTVQILACFLLRNSPWWLIILAAYCFGGVINHALELAVHEISHALAFGHGRPMANRCLAFFANLPIGLPIAISFRKYHLDHHRYQGDPKIDVDLPTKLEAQLFSHSASKLLWLFMQGLIYGLRPFFVNPKPVSLPELCNTIIELSFMYTIYQLCGIKAIVYLLSGTLLAMGIHPVAGHFISEHYMFHESQETYSYYGPLNLVTFNVGYHMEHHDFPYVAGRRLPEITSIAPEYYHSICSHQSWSKVLYDFVRDPAVGPYARMMKRAPVSSSDE